MRDPGAGTKRIASENANKFDDSLVVTAVTGEPVIFEFCAPDTAENRCNELLRFFVAEIVRGLDKDWLVLGQQILAREPCFIDVVRSQSSLPLRSALRVACRCVGEARKGAEQLG